MVEHIEWKEIKKKMVKVGPLQAFLLGVKEGEEVEMFGNIMPGDCEEVLITTVSGTIEIDTFHRDTFGFENNKNMSEVVAWSALPEPFDKLKRNIETWIQDNDGLFHCPKCNEFPLYDADERFCRSDFCPSCGADLRTEVEKE